LRDVELALDHFDDRSGRARPVGDVLHASPTVAEPVVDGSGDGADVVTKVEGHAVSL
jgi:hypothetical protein